MFMDVYGCVYVSKGVYGCSWVFGYLWIAAGVYRFVGFWVSVGVYKCNGYRPVSMGILPGVLNFRIEFLIIPNK